MRAIKLSTCGIFINDPSSFRRLIEGIS